MGLFRSKAPAPRCRHLTIKPVNWVRPEGWFGDHETRIAAMCFGDCGETIYFNMGIVGNPSVTTMVRWLEYRGYQVTSDGLMHKRSRVDEALKFTREERILLLAGLHNVKESPERDALIIRLNPFTREDVPA